jgi:hypothetical protein
VSEIVLAVRTVTERFIGGMAATAEADGGASGKTEFVSGGILNLEIAFDQDWAVVSESNFCWHLFPFWISVICSIGN